MAINNPVIADADIIQDTAGAIQEKDHGGKMEFPDIPNRIRALPSIPIEEKDVNFYDYDGELVYSYTKTEALALEALPALPTHRGLIATEWGYSLLKIKQYLNEGIAEQINNIAGYRTDNGDSRIHMTIPSADYLEFVMSFEINTGALSISINGVPYTTINSSGNVSIVLPSAASYPADYTLSFSFSGTASNSYFNFGRRYNYIFPESFIHRTFVTSVEIGNGYNSTLNHFTWFVNLKNIVIPNNITVIDDGCFSTCKSLKCLFIPDSVTALKQDSIRGCSSLKSVIIPDNVTSIGNNGFAYCSLLDNVIIPDNVTSIGNNGFAYNLSLKKIRLSNNLSALSSTLFYYLVPIEYIKIPNSVTTINGRVFDFDNNLFVIDLTAFTDPTNIPTLAAINAFPSTNSSQFILEVSSQAMYDVFTTATNWSSFATHFVIDSSEVI